MEPTDGEDGARAFGKVGPGGPVAEWTLHPVVEREMAEERRHFLTNRWTGAAFVVAILGLCPLSCLTFVFDLVPPSLLIPAVALVLGLAAAKAHWTDRVATLAFRKRVALRAEYAGVGGWLVELTVFQGATPTGTDRGALWFEDGRLFFVGLRSSFGLTPEQADPRLQTAWALDGLRAAHTLRLRAPTAAGPVSLGLNFIPAEDASAAPFERQFAEAFGRWVAARPEARNGQLPPLAIGPDAPTLPGLFRMAAANTAFWAVFAGALLLLALKTVWWAAIPAALFFGCLLGVWPDVWAPRLRWRAWRDRRRLEGR